MHPVESVLIWDARDENPSLVFNLPANGADSGRLVHYRNKIYILKLLMSQKMTLLEAHI